MSGKLDKKVAIITGASRGIGRAIAERLGRDGALVVVNYARSADKAQEVVEAIETGGSKALAVQADMSCVEDIRHLFDATLVRFGRLDILVNSAGMAEFKPIVDVSEEEFDQLFTLNTRGGYFSLQAAAQHMADGGRIVNISSVSTRIGTPNHASYTGSKAAVEGFTTSLAKELGERGITVNTVSPSGTNTDMFNQFAPPEMKEQIAQMSPLNRIGQPQDVADVVAFLVLEEARWITGQPYGPDDGLAYPDACCEGRSCFAPPCEDTEVDLT